jgi:hypothetical protein
VGEGEVKPADAVLLREAATRLQYSMGQWITNNPTHPTNPEPKAKCERIANALCLLTQSPR